MLNEHFRIRPHTGRDLGNVAINRGLSCHFCSNACRNAPLLFIRPGGNGPSPQAYTVANGQLARTLKLPTIFVLTPKPACRQRELTSGKIFFIVSRRCTRLPNVVTLRGADGEGVTRMLAPITRCVLLCRLRINDVRKVSPESVTPLLPCSCRDIALNIAYLRSMKLYRGVRGKRHDGIMRFRLGNGRL